MSTWSVVYMDGSPRGKYCGEFSPAAGVKEPTDMNDFNNIAAHGAAAIGVPFHGGALWVCGKARLIEFKPM